MSVLVQKTFSTVCTGQLHQAINDNVTIVTVLEQIVYAGGATTDFWFANALSGPESTELDNILGSWSCAAEPTETGDGILDDSNGPSTDILWSSQKITDDFVNETGDEMTGDLTMVGGADICIQSPTVPSKEYCWTYDAATGSPAIRRNDTGGTMVLMPDATNLQWIGGSNAAGTVAFYIDCDNNGELRFNTLHTGAMIFGIGGAVPKTADSGVTPLGTASRRWGPTYVSATDVSGNITVSGTVDGRDIAADGSTLDTHVALVNEHIDWTADQGATNINVGNITSGAVTQHEGSINHNNLLNTHNLTTDIDHDTITNTHNLTTDIDHDQLTNTHNLTTDIDHDQLTNYAANEHATPKNSIEIDSGQLQLVNDSASPGNTKLYGTNGSGVLGWYDQPAGASGEINTASNLGAGVGVFDGKVGVDLQFRSLVSQNNLLSITLDGANDEIDFTVNEGNIDHDGLLNYVANEHATPKNSLEINLGQLQLTNDLTTPGNSKIYGTNATGTKGWYDQPTGGGGSVQLKWKFDSSTSASDPGSGEFRLNNANPALATALYVNEEDEEGVDATTLLNALEADDRIFIQEQEDASKFILVDVVTVTDNGSWFTITFTVDDSGTLFTDGKEAGWVLIYSAGISGVDWGDITGTLSNQTDLQNALDAKAVSGGAEHDGFSDFVANEHIDHSAVSVNSGGILSGGGDLTATRTISLAHSDVDHNQTTNTHNLTTDIDHNTITNGHNLTTDIDHDLLTNFVANEHINHTSVTLTAGAGLSGGGDISANRSFAVNVQNSIEIATDTLQLVGDAASPGNNKRYGTDGTGTKGWYDASTGTGDVVGPGSSIDTRIPRWDGTTGKLLQNPDSGTDLFFTDDGEFNIVTDTSLYGMYITNNTAGGDFINCQNHNSNDLFLLTADGSGNGDLFLGADNGDVVLQANQSGINTEIGPYKINGVTVNIPAGGTAGQFIEKIDGTDYNVQWADIEQGGYDETITVWTLDSGDLYYADVTHNLGTQCISVWITDTTNDFWTRPEEIEVLGDNSIRVYVRGNTHSLKVCVVTGRGPAGPQGPAGSNTVTVSDEGSGLGAFSNLNFVGTAVTATDGGGGTATITITGGASQLSDLSDVNTSTPTNRNVLVADGIDWESRALVEADISDLGSYATQLSELSDVNTSTPTNRNVLVADGIDWESRALVEADISDLGSYLENVSEDSTPSLGGDLDVNEKNFEFDPALSSNQTSSGFIVTATVDTNGTGFGAALYMASDGNFDETDADAAATMPCRALALESGTGSKKILLQGFIRNDSWNWTVGGDLYISTTTGAMTQTAPSGSGDQVQKVGFAWTADIVYFSPGDYTIVEVA